tara:strand:+ start:213 stop:1403 length:1191 start_codon:yes stop_codon:yes gene_type:complete
MNNPYQIPQEKDFETIYQVDHALFDCLPYYLVGSPHLFYKAGYQITVLKIEGIEYVFPQTIFSGRMSREEALQENITFEQFFPDWGHGKNYYDGNYYKIWIFPDPLLDKQHIKFPDSFLMYIEHLPNRILTKQIRCSCSSRCSCIFKYSPLHHVSSKMKENTNLHFVITKLVKECGSLANKLVPYAYSQRSNGLKSGSNETYSYSFWSVHAKNGSIQKFVALKNKEVESITQVELNENSASFSTALKEVFVEVQGLAYVQRPEYPVEVSSHASYKVTTSENLTTRTRQNSVSSNSSSNSLSPQSTTISNLKGKLSRDPMLENHFIHTWEQMFDRYHSQFVNETLIKAHVVDQYVLFFKNTEQFMFNKTDQTVLLNNYQATLTEKLVQLGRTSNLWD